jgi:hypothetical protein
MSPFIQKDPYFPNIKIGKHRSSKNNLNFSNVKILYMIFALKTRQLIKKR